MISMMLFVVCVPLSHVTMALETDGSGRGSGFCCDSLLSRSDSDSVAEPKLGILGIEMSSSSSAVIAMSEGTTFLARLKFGCSSDELPDDTHLRDMGARLLRFWPVDGGRIGDLVGAVIVGANSVGGVLDRPSRTGFVALDGYTDW